MTARTEGIKKQTPMTDVERGAHLRTLRTSKRLTQRGVAAMFGIDKAAVSEWERGKSRPTADKLATLDALYDAHGAVIRLYVTPEAPAVEFATKADHDALEVLVIELAEALRDLTAQIHPLRARGDNRYRELANRVARLEHQQGSSSSRSV